MTRGDARRRGQDNCVLVVDDEPDIRELLDLTLARMGLRAECAGTLAEAYRALESGRFQLCITDMRTPARSTSSMRCSGELAGTK